MNPGNWNLNSMANYAGRLLQCSTIKRTAGFEEIDAVKTSTPAFRLRSGRDLEAQNMPQVREFERDLLSRRNVRCFGARDKEI